MLTGRLVLTLGTTMTVLLGAAACGPPARDGRAGAVAPSSTRATASNQGHSRAAGTVVEVTPTPATGPAGQPTGQSEPGAGAVGGPSPGKPGGGRLPPGKMVLHTAKAYRFSVRYPADFVVRTQPVEKLTQLKPTPAAAFIFMNPVTAASDVVDLEPADLEIRVYVAGQVASLDGWLASNRLLPAGGGVPLKPFRTANVSGVRVCASTLIAPGCSYFALDRGRVYQLTPASVAGETMAKTFMWVS
jgi:hypothetical protein